MYSVPGMILLQLSDEINFSLRQKKKKRMFYSVLPKHKLTCESSMENTLTFNLMIPTNSCQIFQSELAVTVKNILLFLWKNVIFIKMFYLTLKNCVLLLCNLPTSNLWEYQFVTGRSSIALACFVSLFRLFVISRSIARMYCLQFKFILSYPMQNLSSACFSASVNNLY